MWPANEKMKSAKKCGEEAEKLAGSTTTYCHRNAWERLTSFLDVGRSFWHEAREDRTGPWWSKRTSKFKREKVFWSFEAQFWLGGMSRFLNETSWEVNISWKLAERTCRLRNGTSNILARTQDASRISTEPSKIRVSALFDWSTFELNPNCWLNYRVITFAL